MPESIEKALQFVDHHLALFFIITSSYSNNIHSVLNRHVGKNVTILTCPQDLFWCMRDLVGMFKPLKSMSFAVQHFQCLV